MTNNLKLETRAFSADYCNPDVTGCVPKCEQRQQQTNEDDDDKCGCLTTEIDIQKVCEKVTRRYKNGDIKMNAEPSTNAGRYLCEYIYYASLKEDKQRTLFIHVPELSERCSAADIAAAIECTIDAILEQMSARCEREQRSKMHCQ